MKSILSIIIFDCRKTKTPEVSEVSNVLNKLSADGIGL